MDKKKNRTWIVFANESKYSHREALKKLNFINWTMEQSAKFEINDIVYLFMSDDRSIRFKTIVEKKGVEREDCDLWKDKTYRLRFVSEYRGNMLTENELVNHGFNGGNSLLQPNCNNKDLIEYVDSIFWAKPKKSLPENFIVVDMNSGSYLQERIGHECFNLTPDETDNRFYGYCPPHNALNIEKLGASPNDEYVDNVMVIYVEKIKGSKNRKIIAFIDNARVHRNSIKDEKLSRWINENGEKILCSYSIESDYLYDLRKEKEPFVIKVDDYSKSMFRMQRFYNGKYVVLEQKIISYLTDFLNRKDKAETEDLGFQVEIQNEETTYKEKLTDTYKREPSYSNTSKGKTVNKSSRISKQTLQSAGFKCQHKSDHLTFLTPKGVPYMEGHHLIPCTTTNSEYFWKTYRCNIDCEENIVCLCPTCQRRIHFGSKEEKTIIIRDLYTKQLENLQKAGIFISLEELVDLY